MQLYKYMYVYIYVYIHIRRITHICIYIYIYFYIYIVNSVALNPQACPNACMCSERAACTPYRASIP